MKVIDFINQKTKLFNENNNPETGVIILLLEHFLNKDRAKIYENLDYNIPLKELTKMNKMIDKFIYKNYPIQYMIGYSYFCGYKFIVEPGVLIPRFETERIIEIIEKELTLKTILEIGSGSGAISISLKLRNPNLNITATDKYRKPIKITNKNAQILGAKIKVIKSDLFKKVKGKYDLIVSNPPYLVKGETVEKRVLYEPKNALFSKNYGFDMIYHIIRDGEKHLNPNGAILLEINAFHLPMIKEMLDKSYTIKTFEGNNGENRFVLIRREYD